MFLSLPTESVCLFTLFIIIVYRHFHCNYGVNTLLFDRIHGTLRRKNRRYGEKIFCGKGALPSSAVSSNVQYCDYWLLCCIYTKLKLSVLKKTQGFLMFQMLLLIQVFDILIFCFICAINLCLKKNKNKYQDRKISKRS